MTRQIKEHVPAYLDARDVDSVMRLNANLLSEIWMLRDRLAILEHILTNKTILQHNEIDTFTPDVRVEATLENLRAKMIERALKYTDKTPYNVEDLCRTV